MTKNVLNGAFWLDNTDDSYVNLNKPPLRKLENTRESNNGSMFYKIEQTKLSNGLEGFLQNVLQF